MKLDQDDITALAGSIIIHLIALILLFYGVLKTFVPLDDGGMPVQFGHYAVAGIYQPSSGANVTQPAQNTPQTQTQPRQTPTQTQPRQTTPQRQTQTTPQRQTQTTPQRQTQTPQQQTQTPTRPAAQTGNERVITQDSQETASVPDNATAANTAAAEAKAQREREAAEQRQREEEARRLEEQRKQQEAIDNRASSAFGAGGAQENSTGNAATGISNQGSPFGSTETRSTEGSGGTATFNLSGRTTGAGGLPRPVDRGQEAGRIVINITVDPNGNVISAEIGRGTTIDNIPMRNSAIDAAKRAKFNRIQSSNNQSGTITYNYILI